MSVSSTVYPTKKTNTPAPAIVPVTAPAPAIVPVTAVPTATAQQQAKRAAQQQAKRAVQQQAKRKADQQQGQAAQAQAQAAQYKQKAQAAQAQAARAAQAQVRANKIVQMTKDQDRIKSQVKTPTFLDIKKQASDKLNGLNTDSFPVTGTTKLINNPSAQKKKLMVDLASLTSQNPYAVFLAWIEFLQNRQNFKSTVYIGYDTRTEDEFWVAFQSFLINTLKMDNIPLQNVIKEYLSKTFAPRLQQRRRNMFKQALKYNGIVI